MEEISISSLPSDFVEETMTEKRVRTTMFEQSGILRLRRLTLELFNHRWLSIEVNQPMYAPHAYEMDIAVLDPEPKRFLRIAWSYLFIFFALVALTILTGISLQGTQSGLLLFIPASCAVLALVMTVYHTRDRLVFFSEHGRVPLVILYNKQPDKKTFSQFLEQLSKDIQQAKLRFNDSAEALSWELREHRRLLVAGAISEKRYNIVKQRLLNKH